MRLLGVLGLCWLSGCGGNRATPLPPAISYNGSQPFPAVVGETIALTPAVSESIDRYGVVPRLPPGLTLNDRTGVISGTPMRANGVATFTITATSGERRSTFPLVLSVTEPPRHLSYANPVVGMVGAALTPLTPSITGGVEHYSVAPALPAGVVLDGTSGVIAGTPRVATRRTSYTVTASSQAGNTNFIFLLAVTGRSPRRSH